MKSFKEWIKSLFSRLFKFNNPINNIIDICQKMMLVYMFAVVGTFVITMGKVSLLTILPMTIHLVVSVIALTMVVLTTYEIAIYGMEVDKKLLKVGWISAALFFVQMQILKSKDYAAIIKKHFRGAFNIIKLKIEEFVNKENEVSPATN